MDKTFWKYYNTLSSQLELYPQPGLVSVHPDSRTKFRPCNNTIVLMKNLLMISDITSFFYVLSA